MVTDCSATEIVFVRHQEPRYDVSANSHRYCAGIGGTLHFSTEENQEGVFKALVKQWRQEIGPTSTATRMAQQPAYQQIIRLGKAAVPFILAELEKEPDH
jgi:hypothetical protein